MTSDFLYDDPEDKNTYKQWKDLGAIIQTSQTKDAPKKIRQHLHNSKFKYNSNLATAVKAIRKKLLTPRVRCY